MWKKILNTKKETDNAVRKFCWKNKLKEKYIIILQISNFKNLLVKPKLLYTKRTKILKKGLNERRTEWQKIYKL